MKTSTIQRDNHTTEIKNIQYNTPLHISEELYNRMTFSRFVPSITETVTYIECNGKYFASKATARLRFIAPCRSQDSGTTLEQMLEVATRKNISIIVTINNKNYNLIYLLDNLSIWNQNQ